MSNVGPNHTGVESGGKVYDRLYYSERKLWDQCEAARPILRRLERIRQNGIEATNASLRATLEVERLRSALRALVDQTPGSHPLYQASVDALLDASPSSSSGETKAQP